MTTFNKNSWHYRLATVYGPMYFFQDEVDICTYTRYVCLGLLASFITLGLLAVNSVGLLDLGLWLYFNYLGYEVDFIGPAMFPIIFLLVGFIFGLVWIISALYGEVRTSTPSFIKQSYYSWKDRYCFKVRFK